MERFANKAKARAAVVARLSEEGSSSNPANTRYSGGTTMDKPDFTKLNLTGLLNAYNEIAKELREVHGQERSDRKAFQNKNKGIASCEALWNEVRRAQAFSGNDETQRKEKMMTDETNTETTEAPKAKRKPAAKKAAAKKPAKAAKAKKEASTNGHRGRAANYPDTAKIKVLSKENPCREGTFAHSQLELARSSKTFGDFRQAEGNLKYLYSFVTRELVTIS